MAAAAVATPAAAPNGTAAIAAAAEEPPPLFERRIVYRRALTCAAARPPKGAVHLTTSKAGTGAAGANGHGPGSAAARAAAIAAARSDPTRPPPGTELCDETLLDKEMKWKVVKAPAVGLINTGVTCYINATLQCLIHTAPLANYLAGYTTTHRGAGIDWLDALAGVTKFATQPASAKKQFNPTVFSSNLRRLSTTLRRGRLEDAQEFCNFVLDAAHTYQLKKYNDAKDPLVQETTPIKRIFGGYFRSEIRWSKEEELAALKQKAAKTKKPVPEEAEAAPASSSTYEPFMFLTLELVGGSVERSLQHFSNPEVLDGENKYITPSGVKVDAKKVFTVYRSPRVLILHLKRFVSNLWGDTKKINKYTEFSTTLDMRKYATGEDVGAYDLYGIVVHEGRGLHSGHYIAYVKGSNGIWYCCDDEMISQARESDVLKSSAYLLFYQLRDVPKPKAAADAAAAAKAAAKALNGSVKKQQPVPDEAEATPVAVANGHAATSPKAVPSPVANGVNGTANGTANGNANGTAAPTKLSKRQAKLERKRQEAAAAAAAAEAKAKAAAAPPPAPAAVDEPVAATTTPTIPPGAVSKRLKRKRSQSQPVVANGHGNGHVEAAPAAKRVKKQKQQANGTSVPANGTGAGVAEEEAAGAPAAPRKRKLSEVGVEEDAGVEGDVTAPPAGAPADANGPSSPTNPIKKRKKMLQKARKAAQGGKYASASLNAGATFEMPTDKEAYWAQVEKDDKAVADEAAASAWMGKDNSADDTLVLTGKEMGETIMEAKGGQADVDVAKDTPVVANGGERKANGAADVEAVPKKGKLLAQPANPLLAAQREVASYRASAMLEAQANANSAAWDGVDQTQRDALIRKGKPANKKTKKQIMNEEWDRQIDAPKAKKLAKSKRVAKGHDAGHDAFQKGSEAKLAKRQEEDRQKAEGTWEGNEKSDRSKRKERNKNRAYERFH